MKDIFKYIEDIINSKDNLLLFEFGMCDAHHSYKIMDLIQSNKSFEYYGFEPVDYLFNQIKDYKKDYQNGSFTIVNKAIGDKDGLVDFYQSGGQKIVDGINTENYYGSSSINEPKEVLTYWPEMTFEKKQIESIKFDTYVNENNLHDRIIDFIWADIQGAEVNLIKGGKNTFKNVRYFYTEYSNGNLYKGDKGLKGILKLLPNFEIECDYKGDVLLKNKYL